MPYDSETNEYFWTEEEQAWVATHQASWIEMTTGDEYRRPDGSVDYDAIIREVQKGVRQNRLWEFSPENSSRYCLATFWLDLPAAAGKDLVQLRVHRQFSKETKTYETSKVEYRTHGGRKFRDLPGAETFRFEEKPFVSKLHIPNLRVLVVGEGRKTPEYLVGMKVLA
jgi:hypothetical protein